MDSIWRHKQMFLNPRYGIVGLLVFPFFTIFEMAGPVLEVLGLILICISFMLQIVDVWFMLLFLAVSLFFGVFLSIATLALEELSFSVYPSWRDLLRMSGYALAENFGYRQMTLLWRIRGIWSYLRGKKAWGAMTRKGFGKPS